MKKLIVSLVLVAICTLVFAFPEEQHAKITLLVFSGTPNPTWTLNEQQHVKFLELLASNSRSLACDVTHVLGYSGFHVFLPSSQGEFKQGYIYGDVDVELFLLGTLLDQASHLVNRHVMEHVLEVVKSPKEHHPIATSSACRVEISPEVFGHIRSPILDVNIYIRGPDNVTAFDPKKWNGNPQIQYNDNCYNYASDIITETFAQPGRGTGHKWEYNTCESVAAASIRDGQVSYDVFPDKDKQPTLGHFIGLAIWPNVNFHWYRKDLSTNWSHKPGSTPARDTDNSGKLIPDPRVANRGPYTQWCQFFVAIPSNLTIN